jgi:hypothetical protein
VKGHEQDHVPPGRARHELFPGHLPHSMAAVSGGSFPASTRHINCSRDTLDRVQFDMAAAKCRESWWRKWWRRYGCERAEGARREEDDEEVKFKPVLDAQLKRKSVAPRLECRAHRVSETFAYARTPDEIGAHPRDALFPVRFGSLQRPRAVVFKPLRPSPRPIRSHLPLHPH